MINYNKFKNLIKTLINTGKKKRFLTYNEIDETLDNGLDVDEELSEEEVEQLYAILSDKGIEILDDAGEILDEIKEKENNKGQKSVAIEKQSSDEAEHYNNLGLNYYRKNDLDQSREQFEKALSLKPDFSEAHLNLALIYRNKKNILKSLRHLKLCIKYSKDEELREKANLYVREIEDGFEKDDEIETKSETVRLDEEDISETSDKNSDEINNLIKFAQTCKEKGEIEKALAYYKKILIIAPDEAKYYLEIALIYKEKNNYKEALEYLKKCAKKASNSELLSEAKNYITRIEILSLQKINEMPESNTEEKIKTYETLLAENPGETEKVEIYLKLARLYKENKDVNKAITYYNEYLKINKSEEKVHMEIALLYKEKKKIFLALKHLRYCVKVTENEEIKKQAETFIKEIEDFS
ncbi:MAG TPA: tetratricopeptide repeat protein [Candidatus Eremiobacteraeota bacterium]|nr:MAG: photosystem I assembly protein Ycf3 [bacterium ADurb.Bin363]HPZ08237.1 tetratricopeptide repeat protein [Candidatus Eremiobacteraeota bacterium]